MFSVLIFCFFFKQKTAYEMRISDWSSDVCSSDLIAAVMRALGPLRGSICIRDFVEKTGRKASAFGAIVCLIDDGVLDLVGGGPIATHKEVTFAQPLRARACLESSP